jgi:hypothetical protein
MTMEDLSDREASDLATDFEARIEEAGTLIESMMSLDPAAAAEPAAALADLLSGLLEAEDHRSGA